MMIKYCHFKGIDEQGHINCLPLFVGKGLEKTAASQEMRSKLHPAVQDFVGTVRPTPAGIYVLVNAMGASEYWGQNVNGDIFTEKSLLHAPPNWNQLSPEEMREVGKRWDYGFPTFMNAFPYKHHSNKDPSKAFGRVELAVWNPKMHRVELVIYLDRALCKKFDAYDLIERIENGEYPDVSMGCKVPYDVCTICENKSRTRSDYCSHAKSMMNKILPDGRKVGVRNDTPKFFDISFVFIGADKTAKVMAKLASIPWRPASPGATTAVLPAVKAPGAISSPLSTVRRAVVSKPPYLDRAGAGPLTQTHDYRTVAPSTKYASILKAAVGQKQMARIVAAASKTVPGQGASATKHIKGILSTGPEGQAIANRMLSPATNVAYPEYVRDHSDATVRLLRSRAYGPAEALERTNYPSAPWYDKKLLAQVQHARDPRTEQIMASGRHSPNDVVELPNLETLTPEMAAQHPGVHPESLAYRGSVPGADVGEGPRWFSGIPSVSGGYVGPAKKRVVPQNLRAYDLGKIPPGAQGPWTHHIAVDPRGHAELPRPYRGQGTSAVSDSPFYEKVVDAPAIPPALSEYKPLANPFRFQRVRGPNVLRGEGVPPPVGGLPKVASLFQSMKQELMGDEEKKKKSTKKLYTEYEKSTSTPDAEPERNIDASGQAEKLGSALQQAVQMAKLACGDMLQYFQDHPQKLKEKQDRDRQKATRKEKTANDPIKEKVLHQDVPIHIEWKKGETRQYKKNGVVKYKRFMKAHYGYIPGTKDADGEEIDVYLGPDKSAKKAYVIKQLKKDGSFDENKVMIGYPSEAAARASYDHHMGGAKEHFGEIHEVEVSALQALFGDNGDGKEKKPAPSLEKEASAIFGITPEKYASHKKLSEILKDIPAGPFTKKTLPRLESSERDLPNDVLDRMGKLPLGTACSTTGMMGIVLKPREFQRIVLIQMGDRQLADDLDRKHMTFGPSDEVDDAIPVGAKHVDQRLKSLLTSLGFGRDRSAAEGPLRARSSKLRHASKPSPHTSDTPIMKKLAAAYNGYRRALLKKANQISLFLTSDPQLCSNFFGGSLAEAFACGIDKVSSASVLGPDSLAYLAGAYTDRDLHLSNAGVVASLAQMGAVLEAA